MPSTEFTAIIVFVGSLDAFAMIYAHNSVVNSILIVLNKAFAYTYTLKNGINALAISVRMQL